MCNSGYTTFSWTCFVINLNLIKYNLSCYLIFKDNMRKIKKEKKKESFGMLIKIWDLSQNNRNITHKTMNYLKYV
jgi:hypothetical protein